MQSSCTAALLTVDSLLWTNNECKEWRWGTVPIQKSSRGESPRLFQGMCLPSALLSAHKSKPLHAKRDRSANNKELKALSGHIKFFSPNLLKHFSSAKLSWESQMKDLTLCPMVLSPISSHKNLFGTFYLVSFLQPETILNLCRKKKDKNPGRTMVLNLQTATGPFLLQNHPHTIYRSNKA